MLRSRRRRTLTVIVAALVTLPVAVHAHGDSTTPGGTFVDDDGNVHEGYIEAIAGEGVTKGCNPPRNDRYCPAETVRRDQMAAFIRRSLGLPKADRDYFRDDDGSIFEADINALAAKGITKGCNPPDNTRYCPGRDVTRGQMAAFLRRAFGYPQASKDHFRDDNTSVFEGDINAIASAGITKGCNPPDNTRYCPSAITRRDQMASFLGRAMELSPRTPPPVHTFGDGTWRVGSDVPAGTYRNSDSSEGCYWERLSGFSGEIGDVKANDFVHYLTVVTIDSSDEGFRSERCGTWTNRLTQITSSRTAQFGDGMYIVGLDIAPGTWRNSGSTNCYWARLSGFSGELKDIEANNFSDSQQTVTIRSSDAGFETSRCGTWRKIG